MGDETAVTPTLPKIDINIDDILLVDKWKRLKPILEGMVGKRVGKKAYKRNDRIVIYRATDGRIGTMATIGESQTVEELKEYLQKFEKLEVN